MVIYTKEWELFGVIHLHRSQSCFLSLSLSVDEFTCANKGCWKRRFSLSVSLFYALILSFNPSLPFLISQYLSKVATVSSSTRFTRPGASPSLSLTPVWLPSDSRLLPSLYPYFSSNHCDILVCHANRVTFDYQMAASSPVPPAHPFCLISLKWDQSTDPYTSALRTACTAWHDFIWAPAVGSRTPPVLLCILRFCNYRVVSFFG